MPHNLQQRIPINTNDIPVFSLSSRRIVLLGKTGVGKSAAGNTILGQKGFRSKLRMNAVTRVCSENHATVSGRSVTVVDTPGLYDTEMNSEQFVKEMARSMYLSSPGPHAFLIVFPVNMRFTEQEEQIPQQIEMMFGQEVLKYSIILFTHGDQLDGESVEELIEESSRLRHLVQQCGGRFQVFNNRDQNNREQVNDLLQKIDTMIEQNGGGYYSNQMFQDAHRFRRDEEEKRMREEEQRQRQEEELKQAETDKVRRETEQRIRAEYQPDGQPGEPFGGFLLFLSKYKRHIFIAAITAGFVVGGAVGGAAVYGVVGGTVGGGVAGAVVGGAETITVTGAVAGAAVGGAVGAAVGGAVVGAAAAASVGAVAKAVGVGVVGGAAVGGAAGGASSGTVKGAVKGALAGAVVGGAAVGGAAAGAALSGVVGGAAVCGVVAGGAAGGAVVGGAAGGAVVGGAVSRNVAGAVFGGAVVGGAVLAGAGLGGAVGGAVHAGERLGGAVAGGATGEVVRTAGETVITLAAVDLLCNTQQVKRAHFN